MTTPGEQTTDGRAGDREDQGLGGQPRLPARLRIFSYAVEPKAPIYRLVMGAFAAAKERYVLRLRPDEVLEALGEPAAGRIGGRDEIEPVLDQLVAWGNLERIQDTSRARNLEEFLRRRSLYQLTPEGEAAQRAVEQVEAMLDRSGSLQAFMLPALLEDLLDLAARAGAVSLDGGALYAALAGLFGKFESLVNNASVFMSVLNTSIDAGDLADEAFRNYKSAVIVYLDRFLSELTSSAPEIRAAVARVEEAGIDRIVAAAAEADEAPSMTDVSDGRAHLAGRWEGFRLWFVGDRTTPPTLEALRAAGLEAINRVLAIAERVNDKRYRRVNRSADLIQLARWFEGSSEDAAHELCSAAFGLFSARHLPSEVEDEDACRGGSWWDVPPVEVAARLRSSGRSVRTGRVAPIEDTSEARAAALERMRAERARTEAALERFTGSSLPLSQLDTLEPDEFFMLLELLNRALRVVEHDGVRSASSADGRLTVSLGALPAGAVARIATEGGVLSCPDFVLTVRDRAASKVAT